MPNLFADISSWQPIFINWNEYLGWLTINGPNKYISLKASEGISFKDPHYDTYVKGAGENNINVIHYHYARPDLNDPISEALWFHSVVPTIKYNDFIMLDYEINDTKATADWAINWLTKVQQLYNTIPLIYASESYILNRLQDSRLEKFGLVMAKWTFNPNVLPPCPKPWATYVAWQFSDDYNVPGIGTSIDANVFIGRNTMGVPQGWTDNGTILTAPNGNHVKLGFRDWVLSHNWESDNVPLTDEYTANPVQWHGLNFGSGQRQCFLKNILWWTPANGVIQEVQLGKELQSCYDEITSLQNEVKVNIKDLLVQTQAIQTALNNLVKDLS